MDHNRHKIYSERYAMMKRSNHYLHNQGSTIKPPAPYQLKVIQDNIQLDGNQSALEVGIGNATKSMGFAKYFHKYVGLEPDDGLYELSKQNCEQNNCGISIVNKTLAEYNTDERFDVIILIFVLHFLDIEMAIHKMRSLLRDNGIIYIEEPKPEPKGWGSNKLNIDSPEFDPHLWNIKKRETREGQRSGQ